MLIPALDIKVSRYYYGSNFDRTIFILQFSTNFRFADGSKPIRNKEI
jgi:hypothetical protein